MRFALLATVLALTLTAASYHRTSATESGDSKTADVEKLASQIKELRKQMAETPRIVAAGTATLKLGKVQNNSTSVRVQLKNEIASQLGQDYLVLLTNRYSGYPFYVPYWKKANDGFDIILVDLALASDGTVSYIINVNRTFLVDWIVVKK
jgi:hypothetical protein